MPSVECLSKDSKLVAIARTITRTIFSDTLRSLWTRVVNIPLTTTYKAIWRPIANYASQIFAHNCATHNFQKIQRAQKSSLRIITGCYSISSVDHVHQEGSNHIIHVFKLRQILEKPITSLLISSTLSVWKWRTSPAYHLISSVMPYDAFGHYIETLSKLE